MIEEPIIKEHGLTERQVLEIRWRAHERALNRNAMPGGRELLPEEREQLEAKQDAIEYALGNDGREGSKRWSGVR